MSSWRKAHRDRLRELRESRGALVVQCGELVGERLERVHGATKARQARRQERRKSPPVHGGEGLLE
jgi:hypothetical protein